MRFRRRTSESLARAEQALKESHDHLQEVQDRGPEVTKIAKSLRRARIRNHFGEQFELIILGNPHPNSRGGA
jgi:hypothetical protein